MHLTRKDLRSTKSHILMSDDCSVSLVHLPGDPPHINRIKASVSGLDVEIFPSKGFSIGQVFKDGRPIFWNPPIGLCNPDTLDLFSKEVAINGVPTLGFTFLKTFCGGIEFYGLRNWGMPISDKLSKFHHPVHGETSNIPIDHCDVEINDDEVSLIASFVYRDIPAESVGTWYQQGPELFEVKRKVVIGKTRLQIFDRIKNISIEPRKPDWGYHVTFHPSNGSRLLVPSVSFENRSGKKVPENHDLWFPSKNSSEREETGIIHRGLQTKQTENGNLAYALVVHPDKKGLRISFPASPYFQTWFCKGGANSEEFTRVLDGKPLFTKNWDGIGIEFGSSALDHDGNTDPWIPEQLLLEHGSYIEIPLILDFIEGIELVELAEEIRKNNITSLPKL